MDKHKRLKTIYIVFLCHCMHIYIYIIYIILYIITLSLPAGLRGQQWPRKGHSSGERPKEESWKEGRFCGTKERRKQVRVVDTTFKICKGLRCIP